MEHGCSPRIIIEALLDHMELHKAEQQDFGSFLDFTKDNTRLNQANNIGTVSYTGKTTGPPLEAEEFRSPWTHFDGLGFLEGVKPYLQFNGKIQNFLLSKKETIRILQDIWDAKISHDNYIALSNTWNMTSVPIAIDPTNEAPDASKSTNRFGLSIDTDFHPAPTERTSLLPTLSLANDQKQFKGLSDTLIVSLPLQPNMAVFLEHYLQVIKIKILQKNIF